MDGYVQLIKSREEQKKDKKLRCTARKHSTITRAFVLAPVNFLNYLWFHS